jgi:membrane-anchored protein YejM (alkaline phosphatase superfamily)
LDWYFPHSFLEHSGFSELWGYHALPVRHNAPGGRAHARDEAETVSFFLRRFDELVPAGKPAAPTVAVYYSFIAHWPYPDYGEATHILKPVRPINNYYNNLRYLDQQIERIFNHLKERNLLDDTIVVIAGDHGEAFGQHAHNYTHSRASYNENYRTPALIYNPRLFPPRVFTAPTSHVDVLPTLLDAMGVAYDGRWLQGESLYQDRFRRKYIFLYGNEDTVSSISEDLIKLQISFKHNSCWVFDLKVDSDERKPLSCAPHKEQQQALLLYRNNQRIALRRLNQKGQLHGSASLVPAPVPPTDAPQPARHARN